MHPQPPPYDPKAPEAFITLAGARRWSARMAELAREAAAGPQAGRIVRQRHALELAIERLRGMLPRAPSCAELHAARLAGEAVALAGELTAAGRRRLRGLLRAALTGDGTLVPLFHLLRTAAMQVAGGFDVAFTGLNDGTPYDLIISHGSLEVEVACDIFSAEEGRLVHRRTWSQLVDRLDTDLRAWLTTRPGGYLLKMTLPQGLERSVLAEMHERIRRLLQSGGRRDHDEAAVLRLDPLLLSEAAAADHLVPLLRREFGPEAHLAVTAAGGGLLAMAARAGRADEIAVAMRRRLYSIAPQRLSARRPGILAMFIDDTDRSEWRGLRERLELEGETRQFLANKAARPVLAVTCSSRLELLGLDGAVEDGELRYRNPAHPAARTPALGPAILSSV